MKIAVTVWDERISPVFDSAHTLLVAEVKDKKIKQVSYKSFDPQLEARFAEKIQQLGIDVLICGAISQKHSTLIEAGSIELVPFINGNANEIIESFAKGNPLAPAYLMPGC